MTLFLNGWKPQILHSIISPFFNGDAPGVPVEIISQGNNVIIREWYETKKSGGNVMLATIFSA